MPAGGPPRGESSNTDHLESKMLFSVPKRKERATGPSSSGSDYRTVVLKSSVAATTKVAATKISSSAVHHRT
eukprot:766930-Hanusia_phi.AAC.2